MKKFILIAAAILLSTGAFAQKGNWGIKAGFNGARETTGEANTGMRAGIYAGLFTEVKIAKYVGMQIELQYSMQGATSKISGTTTVDQLDYVNLPVIFKFYISDSGFSIDAGLQPGVLVNGKAKTEGISVSIYEHLNKFDLALAVGTSYRISERFDVGFRFNIGVLKIMDRLDNMNSVFQLGLGYRF